MTDRRKVTIQHIPPNRKDIILSVGEIVEIGKKYVDNPNWKNWVWCISKNAELTGWVPKQYLRIDGNSGTVIKEYSSVELPVEIGEKLTVHYHLNGWAWCTDTFGNQGWIPDEKFE